MARFRGCDKTVLDHAGLRVHAHCLLDGRLAARDAMAAIRNQVLDQLCSGGLVLDQHNIRTKLPLLVEHRTFELRIFEASAEETNEKDMLVFHPPRRAHRKITELGRLVGGVPALHRRFRRSPES